MDKGNSKVATGKWKEESGQAESHVEILNYSVCRSNVEYTNMRQGEVETVGESHYPAVEWCWLLTRVFK